MKIHIAYENIDAELNMVPTHRIQEKKHISKDGKKVRYVRALVYDAAQNSDSILKDPAKLAEEDLEINIELAGQIVEHTTRIVVNKEYEPVYTYRHYDILEKPSGELMERPHAISQANVDEKIPVKISEQYFDPKDVISKFVVRKSYYLIHNDGMSYKFLFDIAKKLHDLGKMVRLIGYDQQTKKPTPIVLITGGASFPAVFLEGKIQQDQYCLRLLLADRELKFPPPKSSQPSQSAQPAQPTTGDPK
jgi:hypothetical protein